MTVVGELHRAQQHVLLFHLARERPVVDLWVQDPRERLMAQRLRHEVPQSLQLEP